jgi:hypothetical protein
LAEKVLEIAMGEPDDAAGPASDPSDTDSAPSVAAAASRNRLICTPIADGKPGGL